MVRKNAITVIVPCFNEQRVLRPFLEAVINVQKDLPANIELLLIDDGSTDQTLRVIKEMKAAHPDHIEYLSFSRNFGKEAGLYAGLQHAKGEYVALMDADLQDPPEMLVSMYQILQDPAVDAVVARRNSRAGEPLVRNIFARLFYHIFNRISNIQLEEGVRDFRMMKAQVVDAVVALGEYGRFSKGIFSWVGFNVRSLEYPHINRIAGKSSWSFRGLFDYAIDGLISFSDFPLKLATGLGAILMSLGTLYGLIQLVRWMIASHSVSSFAGLIFLILWVGGSQLFCLGLLGKYIGKIFFEQKKRPLFLVREEQLFDE